MNLESKPLYPGDEVMLTKNGRRLSPESFNPYYGLVVLDMFGAVTVLWEDGVERIHQRHDLLSKEEQETLGMPKGT